MQYWQLKQRQSLPLEAKVELSRFKIRKWYEHWVGDVYVSFSGGKDSTVLLDLVRSEYPDVPAVFVDTGLEYPEIRDFIKTVDNVTWLKPKMTFKQVIEKYGYPVISKKVSMGLSRFRNTKSSVQKDLRLNGGINPTSGKKQYRTIPLKWHYMTDAPFKCGEGCCDALKKRPVKRYGKESNRKAFIGTMAHESSLRSEIYLKTGCNAFDNANPTSTPMAFWNDEDVWAYIKSRDLPYSKIYDMGEKRTGCMFCMFGVHMEKGENRFQRMSKSHPKQYGYCMDKLGLKGVLDYMGVAC
ncbi:phosphoadenosine phosphosulfate reductase family protein [Candidatus Pacearchaeota archaeon]|nr:phosphoadenosine phosphosulfate reductase family protein [Candidatus Pacearchaeota archaeon]